jgi:hypothetical protein
MKKGLSLWFKAKKFGKEFVLERFAVHIEVMCGVIQGGGKVSLQEIKQRPL